MRRIVLPSAGDPVTDRETPNILANRDHGACAAVAEGDRGVQSLKDHFHGIRDAVSADFIDDLSHEIRSCHGLAEQAFLRDIDGSLFSSSTDQRTDVGDQQAITAKSGDGNIADAQIARTKILNDLLHVPTRCSVWPDFRRPPFCHQKGFSKFLTGALWLGTR